jgi:hypothetical protein
VADEVLDALELLEVVGVLGLLVGDAGEVSFELFPGDGGRGRWGLLCGVGEGGSFEGWVFVFVHGFRPRL